MLPQMGPIGWCLPIRAVIANENQTRFDLVGILFELRFEFISLRLGNRFSRIQQQNGSNGLRLLEAECVQRTGPGGWGPNWTPLRASQGYGANAQQRKNADQENQERLSDHSEHVL